MEYHPQAKRAALLDIAYDQLQSVPYSVSARWLFYRLLQLGHYRVKDDYRDFLSILSLARKGFYKLWTPDSLMDDTRSTTVRGDGCSSEEHFLRIMSKETCVLDKWMYQDYYLEIWFEAKAMQAQFEYYTEYITLRPFGGDPSIPFKSQIAKDLIRAYDCFDDHPIIILYFGDNDPKGFQIPISAVHDIRDWVEREAPDVEFEFIRCGLNPGDEITYDIPENPDKPGTYQWEALTDEAAQTIITAATEPYINQEAFSQVEEEEQEITIRFRKRMEDL